jgi:hypothetical protein
MLSREDANVSLVRVFWIFLARLTERGPDFRTVIQQMYALSLQSMIQGQVVPSAYLLLRSPLSSPQLTHAASLPG